MGANSEDAKHSVRIFPYYCTRCFIVSLISIFAILLFVMFLLYFVLFLCCVFSN